jgi:putative flippase GtrA
MALKIELLKQIIRFGLVGSSAALVNFSIVVALVESGLLTPLVANVVAFFIAFHVSYFGHRYWTFSRTSQTHKTAMPRLLLLSISNFIINEGIFYVFLNTFKLPYPLALFFTLAVLPVITFTINKLWVFREST